MRDRLIVVGVVIFGLLALMFDIGDRAVNWLDAPLTAAFFVCVALFRRYVSGGATDNGQIDRR